MFTSYYSQRSQSCPHCTGPVQIYGPTLAISHKMIMSLIDSHVARRIKLKQVKEVQKSFKTITKIERTASKIRNCT